MSPTTEQQLLTLRNISHHFGQNNGERLSVVSGFSTTVGQHEIVSLIGPSGCGKSTLLDIAAGIFSPSQGEVILGDETITGTRGRLGYMLQEDLLLPWRTLIDNLILPLEIQGVSRQVALEKARQLLLDFGLLAFENAYPATLSGGMRQRAAFLRTYLSGKPVLLLDEPFSRLDALTRSELQQWLLGKWENLSCSILLVTHDIEEAVLLSDRVLVLSERPAKIKLKLAIELPRPRPGDVRRERLFINYAQEIRESLFASGRDPETPVIRQGTVNSG